MSDSELACVYSALILHDAGVPISVSLVYGPSLLATRSPIWRLFPHHAFCPVKELKYYTSLVVWSRDCSLGGQDQDSGEGSWHWRGADLAQPVRQGPRRSESAYECFWACIYQGPRRSESAYECFWTCIYLTCLALYVLMMYNYINTQFSSPVFSVSLANTLSYELSFLWAQTLASTFSFH